MEDRIMLKCIVFLACVLAFRPGMAAEPEIINLARTSLAEVTGSPINGGRPIDSPFYGVLNLFDDGQHRLNNLAYTYWVGDQADSWVELHFRAPVTLTAIELEAPEEAKKVLDGISQRDYLLGDKRLPFPIQFMGTFSLVAYTQEGTIVFEKTVSFFELLNPRGGWPPFSIHDVLINCPQPLKGITRIRLQANARIDEWRVLGIPPAGGQRHPGGKPVSTVAEVTGERRRFHHGGNSRRLHHHLPQRRPSAVSRHRGQGDRTGGGGTAGGVVTQRATLTAATSPAPPTTPAI
jgi:hypothetical protein